MDSKDVDSPALCTLIGSQWHLRLINESHVKPGRGSTHRRSLWLNNTVVHSRLSLACTVHNRADNGTCNQGSRARKPVEPDKLEAKTPLAEAPGVRRRYDDFVATHIKQTFAVHNTGNFLGWHRFLTWTYEQVLRDECGYDGYQPYYNWPKWSDDPASSPALDGSDTSMSGNGELGCTEQVGYGIPTNDAPSILIPHGEGGGCLADGPFKDFGMNLGPVFSGLTCTPANPMSNFSDPDQLALLGLGYNPRCLKRDISPWTSSQWTNDEQVVSLLECDSIYCFWANMQGGLPAFENNFMGVHTAGHFTIGGDPGSDFVASNGDPWFYLHHAQIDRVWWMWQNQHPEERTNAIYGTITLADTPPSRNATLDDDMALGYASEKHITLGESMSTMGGPFCYRYT